MASLKQIIAKMQAFASTHAQIGEVIVGTYFKVDTTTRKYPIMVITPTPSNINNTSLNLNFDIMFGDILDGEESNLLDVWSDQLQTATDFISYFATGDGYNDDDLRLDESSVVLEPFQHLVDNECAGYFMSITMIAPQPLDYCAKPTK